MLKKICTLGLVMIAHMAVVVNGSHYVSLTDFAATSPTSNTASAKLKRSLTDLYLDSSCAPYLPVLVLGIKPNNDEIATYFGLQIEDSSYEGNFPALGNCFVRMVQLLRASEFHVLPLLQALPRKLMFDIVISWKSAGFGLPISPFHNDFAVVQKSSSEKSAALLAQNLASSDSLVRNPAFRDSLVITLRNLILDGETTSATTILRVLRYSHRLSKAELYQVISAVASADAETMKQTRRPFNSFLVAQLQREFLLGPDGHGRYLNAHDLKDTVERIVPNVIMSKFRNNYGNILVSIFKNAVSGVDIDSAQEQPTSDLSKVASSKVAASMKRNPTVKDSHRKIIPVPSIDDKIATELKRRQDTDANKVVVKPLPYYEYYDDPRDLVSEEDLKQKGIDLGFLDGQ